MINKEVEDQLVKTAMSILGQRSAAKNGAKRDYKGMGLKSAANKRAKKAAQEATDTSNT